MSSEILAVKNLQVSFNTVFGELKAVRDVSYTLNEGETLGIVGESGSGKSVSSLALLNLVPPPGKIKNGEIIFEANNILNLSKKEIRKIRGEKISMIFQDPFTSLNPVFTVGEQIAEMLRTHKKLNKKDAWDGAVSLLKKVDIPNAELRANDYPHQLSGGMRQRVMIAIALSCKPKILIADEPTTALDVTIQAQILDLLNSLKNEYQMSVILITHNLALVAQNCDKVIVMYAGLIMESAPAEEIFIKPQNPYTIGLLNCLPVIDKKVDIKPIPGNPPNLLHLPEGCPFSDRCEKVFDKCNKLPDLFNVGNNHQVRCWLYEIN